MYKIFQINFATAKLKYKEHGYYELTAIKNSLSCPGNVFIYTPNIENKDNNKFTAKTR